MECNHFFFTLSKCGGKNLNILCNTFHTSQSVFRELYIKIRYSATCLRKILDFFSRIARKGGHNLEQFIVMGEVDSKRPRGRNKMVRPNQFVADHQAAWRFASRQGSDGELSLRRNSLPTKGFTTLNNVEHDMGRRVTTLLLTGARGRGAGATSRLALHEALAAAKQGCALPPPQQPAAQPRRGLRPRRLRPASPLAGAPLLRF